MVGIPCSQPHCRFCFFFLNKVVTRVQPHRGLLTPGLHQAAPFSYEHTTSLPACPLLLRPNHVSGGRQQFPRQHLVERAGTVGARRASVWVEGLWCRLPTASWPKSARSVDLKHACLLGIPDTCLPAPARHPALECRSTCPLGTCSASGSRPRWWPSATPSMQPTTLNVSACYPAVAHSKGVHMRSSICAVLPWTNTHLRRNPHQSTTPTLMPMRPHCSPIGTCPRCAAAARRAVCRARRC